MTIVHGIGKVGRHVADIAGRYAFAVIENRRSASAANEILRWLPAVNMMVMIGDIIHELT